MAPGSGVPLAGVVARLEAPPKVKGVSREEVSVTTGFVATGGAQSALGTH